MAIPAPESGERGDTANKTKMLLGKQLNIAVIDFFRRWEGDEGVTVQELRERIDMWFQNNLLHEIFSKWLDRCEDYKDGFPYNPTEGHGEDSELKELLMRELGERRSPRTIILNVDPLKSRVFRRHVRKYLFEDFAARFRDVPEILTQMAWLLGADERKQIDPSETRVPNLGDDLGL